MPLNKKALKVSITKAIKTALAARPGKPKVKAEKSGSGIKVVPDGVTPVTMDEDHIIAISEGVAEAVIDHLKGFAVVTTQVNVLTGNAPGSGKGTGAIS